MTRKTLINWEQVIVLCKLMCTRDEVARVFHCSGRTLENASLREQHMTWTKFFEANCAEGKVSIRRHLFKESESGNVAASIFLAKNYLGMSDKQEIEQNVKVTNVTELSDAELVAIARGGRLGTIKTPPVTPSIN